MRISGYPADHGAKPPIGGASPEQFARELAHSFGHKGGVFTFNGRTAITALLCHLKMNRDEEVYITTTFDYPNVSSTVSCTIFNICKPSRVLTPQTRMIFVIHEFGVPHPQTPELRAEASRRGIPFVEDCAHTIDSVAPAGWRVGEMADWIIVSFNKIFPVSKGGMLIGPPVAYAPTDRERQTIEHCSSQAAAWWPSWPEQAKRRRQIYRQLTKEAVTFGIKPLYEINNLTTPFLFPVLTDHWENLLALAQELNVACGLWHGSNIVALPCHQELGAAEIGLISQILKSVSLK